MRNFNEIFSTGVTYDKVWLMTYSFYSYPLPILRDLHILLFIIHFFHASYAIYILYQCFHSVNLTLYTVTSIRSRRLKNKIQLETRKQDESCQKIQDPRQREKEIKLARKRVWRKRTEKSVSRKKFLMHHLKVILILLLKKNSSEILHACRCCCQ